MHPIYGSDSYSIWYGLSIFGSNSNCLFQYLFVAITISFFKHSYGKWWAWPIYRSIDDFNDDWCFTYQKKVISHSYVEWPKLGDPGQREPRSALQKPVHSSGPLTFTGKTRPDSGPRGDGSGMPRSLMTMNGNFLDNMVWYIDDIIWYHIIYIK